MREAAGLDEVLRYAVGREEAEERRRKQLQQARAEL
jgi:hypothetical protein